jgi:hypothetical protein
MKLYKLSVILGDSTVERGVWANTMVVSENTIQFKDSEYEIVAMFPANRTFITSIETQEQVEERKRAREESLAALVDSKFSKK